MLESLDIKDRIITADSMHTQRETARLISKKGGDYVLTVKENQKTLHSNIMSLNWAIVDGTAETTDKGHGRLEIRKIQTRKLLNYHADFPQAKQAFRIERTRTLLKTRRVSKEIAFEITSCSKERLSAATLLETVRGHWRIENCLHYVRDMAYDEDRSTVRKHNGPGVMATLRNFALNVFRLNHIKNITKAIREFAARPHLSLAILGF